MENMETKGTIFNKDDIESFQRFGYIIVKNVFTCDIAKQCNDEIWKKLNEKGIKQDDTRTWILKQDLDIIFDTNIEPFSKVMSSKFLKSIDELCGIGSTYSFGLGWWTITFPGISIPPWTVNGHYHIDGNVLISGGGTTVVEGSHLEASNILFEAGLKGCGSKELNNKVTEYCFENESNIVELTGNIGDIVFMHPFLLHARSTNISPVNLDSVRVLCHPTISLKNNMNFCKPFSELSIVEQSIVLSLVDDEASFFDEINSNLDYTSSLSNPRLNLVNSITPLNCEKYLNEIINLKRKHDLL